MEINLDLEKIISLAAIIKTLSWMSLPFVLSFIIPAFYIAFKKFTENTPVGANLDNLTFANRIFNLFKAPIIERYVLILSICLLIFGMVLIKIEQSTLEKKQLIGLQIKKYMVSKGFYATNANEVCNWFNDSTLYLNAEIIQEVCDLFPNDLLFSVPNNTILLVSDTLLIKIVDDSQKVLHGYLNSFEVDTIINMTHLFEIDNHFTYEVVKKAIVNHPDKYYYLPDKNCILVKAIKKT